MLPVDEDEIVPGGLGDARDVARARQPHDHAERDVARAHALFDGVLDFVGLERITPLRCRPRAGGDPYAR